MSSDSEKKEEKQAMETEADTGAPETHQLISAGASFGKKCPCMWYYMQKMMTGDHSIRVINSTLTILMWVALTLGSYLMLGQALFDAKKECDAQRDPENKTRNCDTFRIAGSGYMVAFAGNVFIGLVGFAVVIVFLFNEILHEYIRYALGGLIASGGIILLAGISTVLNAFGTHIQGAMIVVMVGEVLLASCAVVLVGMDIALPVFQVENSRLLVVCIEITLASVVLMGGYAARALYKETNVVQGEYVTLAVAYGIIAVGCLMYLVKSLMKDPKEKVIRMVNAGVLFLGGFLAFVGYLVFAINVGTKKNLYLAKELEHPFVKKHVDTGLLASYYVGYMFLIAGITKVLAFDLIMPDPIVAKK